MRVIISDLLPTRSRRRAQRTIFIYGAGKSGQELAVSMRSHPEMRMAGFFDDNPHLQGSRVNGVAFWGARNLGYVLSSHAFAAITLALPRVSRDRHTGTFSKLGT